MCRGADQLAVLNDWAAAHECGQVGTTHFYNFLTVLTPFVKKNGIYHGVLACFLTQTDEKRTVFFF